MNYSYHTKRSVAVSRRKTMTRSCRIGISDYTKKPALISSHHEQSSNPNEIILPTMASSVACQKNRKGKSLRLDFQREKSAQGLRSTLRREKSVSRGLGLGISPESGAPRGLGFSNRTARAIQGKEEEEIQFDFPKRPRTKRQRQRDGDIDGGASTRTGIKIVYDSKTQKHSIVSGVVAVSPVKQSRKASSMIFHRGPSFDDKKESCRMASSPIAVIDLLLSADSNPMISPVIIAPEDRRRLRVPIKSNTQIIPVSQALKENIHVGCAVPSAVFTASKLISHAHTENVKSRSPSGLESKPRPKHPWAASVTRRRGNRIQELIDKMGIQ
jgi:hypothetical protein